MEISCVVVAPALIPKAPGDRVKTDKRDSVRLARLHQSGQLVAIHVPTPQEEAVRDLCRARADVVDDRSRTQHRLSKFLLRHDRIWHDSQWTQKHEQWMLRQHFEEPALRSTLATTARCWPPATLSSPRSRRNLSTGTAMARSPRPYPGWPPTGVWPTSER
jgi:transposase